MDGPGSDENAQRLRDYLKPEGIEVLEVCAAIGEGTAVLLEKASDMLGGLPVPKPVEEDGVIEEWALEREDMGFDIAREDGVYYVEGHVIHEILAKTDPDVPDSMRHFQKLLKDFGIIKALRKAGAQTGDTVSLEGLEFDFVD